MSRAGGGGRGGDDGGGSDPPGEGDDERFSDSEVGDVAAHVVELFPDGLTIGLFNAAIWPFVFGLDAEEERDAKERIYAALPDRLRVSILGDVLARSAPRAPVEKSSGGGETPCRICGEPFEPLRYVDENGICPDCWTLPEPRGGSREALQIGPGTWAHQRAADSLHVDRQSQQAEGGAA